MHAELKEKWTRTVMLEIPLAEAKDLHASILRSIASTRTVTGPLVNLGEALEAAGVKVWQA